MKNKALFLKSLTTLFFSWGGDPAPEVFWTGNDLLDWYEKEFNVSLGLRFEEENYYNEDTTDDGNIDKIFNLIKNS